MASLSAWASASPWAWAWAPVRTSAWAWASVSRSPSPVATAHRPDRRRPDSRRDRDRRRPPSPGAAAVSSVVGRSRPGSVPASLVGSSGALRRYGPPTPRHGLDRVGGIDRLAGVGFAAEVGPNERATGTPAAVLPAGTATVGHHRVRAVRARRGRPAGARRRHPAPGDRPEPLRAGARTSGRGRAGPGRSERLTRRPRGASPPAGRGAPLFIGDWSGDRASFAVARSRERRGRFVPRPLLPSPARPASTSVARVGRP